MIMTKEVVKYNDLTRNAKQIIIEQADIPKDISFFNIFDYRNDNREYYNKVGGTDVCCELFDYVDNVLNQNFPHTKLIDSYSDAMDITNYWEYSFNDNSSIVKNMDNIQINFSIRSDGDHYKTPYIRITVHTDDDEIYLEFCDDYSRFDFTEATVFNDIISSLELFDEKHIFTRDEIEDCASNITDAVLAIHKEGKNAVKLIDRKLESLLPYALDEMFEYYNATMILDYDERSGDITLLGWKQ